MSWTRLAGESGDASLYQAVVVIVCSIGLLYATRRAAFSCSRRDWRRTEVGVMDELGGRGELRRILCSVRGCV